MTDQKRDDENVTAFTLRRIRNEVLEDAAKWLETHMPDPRCHVSLQSAAAIVRGMKQR